MLEQMMCQVSAFLATRTLAANSQQSYRYDLQQFCQTTRGQVTDQSLRRYEESLLGLKATARNRKLSVVNQFLYFLYEQGELTRFYRLKSQQVLVKNRTWLVSEQLNLSRLYQIDLASTGQLIALLILELGLTPSELVLAEMKQFDLDFKLLRLIRKQQVRVLPLSDVLLPFLLARQAQTYLFEHDGQRYSRQWFHRQLSNYLRELGLSEVSAQRLREEYIKRQVEQGMDAQTLAKHLGLKSLTSLERYYK
ncbi:site-specific tyrosine recombinase XerD [Streptococcus cuniculipharyngis]|uniref:Site-specific tyrosine recombinase XerD n=1 Tax=Streptococcus cuniculipharyngis TaxID=1562651 RepID=A0A5C5SB78_9STRE|nr:site-specific tyrosine recombinase XerD [Streptococcus cuniculipharyngis]TWS98137.1 site-specific tyrosine recombinase XerD [Streptococcus cuniculipharyngis]